MSMPTTSTPLLAQFSLPISPQYLGYSLHALAGLRIERQDFKEAKARITSQTFITIYAGLE